MEQSTHGEHSFQPLKTKKIQFKNAVTFSIGYFGIVNVTNKKIKITGISVFEGAEYNIFSIPQGQEFTR